MSKRALLTAEQLSIIRGKVLIGHATPKEMLSVFHHYDIIKAKMDELDEEDFFGTEGWRHFFGLPDAD